MIASDSELMPRLSVYLVSTERVHSSDKHQRRAVDVHKGGPRSLSSDIGIVFFFGQERHCLGPRPLDMALF